MSWISRLLGGRPRLDPAEASALAAYSKVPLPDPCAAVASLRLVVVDVETSGLDARRDRLLAIGAVGVRDGSIPPGDAFETVLRQARASDHENILVHGIDETTQLAGSELADALARFLAYAGKAPLVAFHANFDRAMIARAMHPALGITPANRWLDLAAIAPVMFPEHARSAQTLDDWLRIFGIEHPARHNALADAFATAQLLLVTIARAQSAGARRLEDLITASTSQRWLLR